MAASGERSFTGIGAAPADLSNGPLAAVDGIRTTRKTGLVMGPPRTTTPTDKRRDYEPPPCEDCDLQVGRSNNPGVPKRGRLRQLRMQGAVESTDHDFTGLGNYGYPVIVHVVAMTNGHGGTVGPKYIYEHDYKIKNNGYVSTTPGYSWESNLPGAYRDTRARGIEGPDDMLDFTVGSVYTWKLDGSKTYKIRTLVLPPKAPTNRSSARLTASVIPNDGGFDVLDAALGRGCHFTTDPWLWMDPDDIRAINVAAPAAGNLAWCGGVGDMVHASYVKNVSYVSTKPFPIRYFGTCRKWVLNNAFTWC